MTTWPCAAQRVLLVFAASLLAFAAALGGDREPGPAPLPDDQSLELRLDINRASAADLETIPGIGAALAGRIERDRRTRGPYRDLKDLQRVPGIGERLVESLRPLASTR